ncbi:MAG: alpha/beta hydrolase, partial [Frankiaceae bacterium]|nr:alpha/beta hydrolase [Frankiaceae bacterium]
MALDEASRAVIAAAAAAGRKPLAESTPAEARAMSGANRAVYGPGPDMASISDETVPSTGGSFGVRVLVPPGEVQGLILYCHGGGWVLGDLDNFTTLAKLVAVRARCAVVMVDYRLAPEHRFPTAVEDAWAALRWADERRAQIAGREVPLIVAGESAGGNLSAVLALRARDEDGPQIALQVLIYPATDFDPDNASHLDPENQLLLSRAGMLWFWDHYVPDPADRHHPHASPLRAPDLSRLPPALVLTAEHDVLSDEGAAYARALAAAGVPV